MSKFKGFDDWVEIFKGGKQVDSSGREHDGDAMIDKAVSSFNAGEHEPPLVIGHPKDNSPSFGWANELKTEMKNGTKVLLASFKDVVPEFEELVRTGRYKKRSAAFYPDGRLRHVGFLGAVPPAVKGLADLNFKDEEQEPVSFEFYDHKLGILGRVLSGLREMIIEDKGIETADRIIPNWDIDSLKEEASREEEETSAVYHEQEPTKTEVEMKDVEGKQFSEADVKAAEDAAAAKAKEEGKQEAAREYAEAENKRLIVEFKERNWPKGGKGKLPPALLDAGVMEFMAQIDGSEAIEFAEGDDKKTPLAWFMEFLEGLKTSAVFTEVATRDQDNLPDNEDAEDIAKRAREFKDSEEKAGRVVSISEAVDHVTKA